MVWASERYYDVLGSRFLVRAEVGQVAELVDHLLAPFRRSRCSVPAAHRYSLVAAEGEGHGHHRLYRDCWLQRQARTWAPLTEEVLASVNRGAIDGFAGFAVHAGVVAKGGHAVAFPAVSGQGKSTITAACLAAGFDYVSDEALCVEFATRRVVPYPKPLTLSVPGCQLLGVPVPVEQLNSAGEDVGFRPEELGSATAEGGLRLHHVVRLVRRTGPPRLRPLPAVEAVALLLGLSFNHYKHPRESFELVTALARHSRVWELDCDHPRPAAALLWERLGRAPAAAMCPSS